MASFGERLRQLRNEKSLTQEQFAKIFNMKKSRVSQYELSKRQADDELKKMFADYFNVSIDYLLGYTDVREPAHEIIKKAVPVNSDITEKNIPENYIDTTGLSEESRKELEKYLQLLKLKESVEKSNNDESSCTLEKRA